MEFLSKIVKVKEYNKNALLSAYGLDSLSMVEFGSNIQHFFNVQINQATFYKHSLNSLTDEIELTRRLYIYRNLFFTLG